MTSLDPFPFCKPTLAGSFSTELQADRQALVVNRQVLVATPMIPKMHHPALHGDRRRQHKGRNDATRQCYISELGHKNGGPS